MHNNCLSEVYEAEHCLFGVVAVISIKQTTSNTVCCTKQKKYHKTLDWRSDAFAGTDDDDDGKRALPAK